MNKEDMIKILNQHGIDVLHSVIEDELSKAYDTGYEDGIFDSCDLIEPDNCDNNLDAKLLSQLMCHKHN